MQNAAVLKVSMLAVSRSGLTSLTLAAAMATNPTMEFDYTGILSSMGRTERVTCFIAFWSLSCPYQPNPGS